MTSDSPRGPWPDNYPLREAIWRVMVGLAELRRTPPKLTDPDGEPTPEAIALTSIPLGWLRETLGPRTISLEEAMEELTPLITNHFGPLWGTPK